MRFELIHAASIIPGIYLFWAWSVPKGFVTGELLIKREREEIGLDLTGSTWTQCSVLLLDEGAQLAANGYTLPGNTTTRTPKLGVANGGVGKSKTPWLCSNIPHWEGGKFFVPACHLTTDSDMIGPSKV
jgi:hypothetical protein